MQFHEFFMYHKIQILGAQISHNRRKIEIQILRETEVCQYGKTISGRVLQSFPLNAQNLSCYFGNLSIFSSFLLSKVHSGFTVTCKMMHSELYCSKIVQ